MQFAQQVGASTSVGAIFGLSEPLSGVHVLPRMFSSEDIRRILTVQGVKSHHDEDDGHHVGKEKPSRLPWVAARIRPYVRTFRPGSLRTHSVDEWMKLYRLQAGRGAVIPHQDRDFDGPDGSRALYSILVYLNDDYAGGETVFNGKTPAPHAGVGGGLLFRHDILHEGLVVQSGEKFVLKTDLFLRSI